MTGPDRIWIDRHGGNWSPMDGGTQDIEYIRRDPAVLAALPEVQALIAAAYEVAERNLRAYCVSQVFKETLTEQLCSAIGTPAHATAALAARDAAMIARGLREAAGIDWASGRDVSDTAPNYLSDWQRGLVAGQNAMRDAILALADQIERDAK